MVHKVTWMIINQQDTDAEQINKIINWLRYCTGRARNHSTLTVLHAPVNAKTISSSFWRNRVNCIGELLQLNDSVILSINDRFTKLYQWILKKKVEQCTQPPTSRIKNFRTGEFWANSRGKRESQWWHAVRMACMAVLKKHSSEMIKDDQRVWWIFFL